MYGLPGGFSSYTTSYPSNPNFLTVNRNSGALQEPVEHGVSERQIASSQLGLLVPALVGAGAAFLFFLLSGEDEEKCNTKRPRRGEPGIVIYTFIATAGVSIYVYNVLTASNGNIITAFAPVTFAISSFILYFSAIYAWLNKLVPGSFEGKIGENLISQLITWIYFSITTFATASMGDIAPVTAGAKILVSIQVLFFIFIFTMGIVFFTQPSNEHK